MTAESFDFGRDPVYALEEPAAERSGICFFSRPETPRRATELAILALDLLAARHPEVDIHLYGDSVKDLPFRVIDHGLQTPSELSTLYNRCVAGLVLSATNVSLVPHEMLAAGCIPVVNDAAHNRLVLDNDHVAFAAATPFELADTLSALVERPPSTIDAAAQAAADSVQGASWEAAGESVVHIVETAVRNAAHSTPSPDAALSPGHARRNP
jgi:O-antigen biosynthesis protein